MTKPEKLAFDTTKEIVIARMTNTTIATGADGGKKVGEFFQEIYNKVLEIAKNIEE